MILSVRVDTYSAAFTKMTDEEYASLRQKIPTMPERAHLPYTPFLVDHDDLTHLSEHKLRVEFTDCASGPAGTMLVRLQNMIEKLGGRVDDMETLVKEKRSFRSRFPTSV